MQSEVHWQTYGQGDDDWLEDVELPAQHHQDTHAAHDDAEHGEDGEHAEQDVPGADQEDDEAEDHGHSDGSVGSLQQTVL